MTVVNNCFIIGTAWNKALPNPAYGGSIEHLSEKVKELETEVIKVNATAVLSLGQVILAVKQGVSYISIFARRIADEGGNAHEIVRNSVGWLECRYGVRVYYYHPTPIPYQD